MVVLLASGAPRARNRYATPSGMLLKAVLIAGAAEVTGEGIHLLTRGAGAVSVVPEDDVE